MSVTPRIAMVAWEGRSPGFIFVAVPTERGRYVRTDRSVAFVPCGLCGAMVGEPCRTHTRDGYQGTTHVMRRTAARKHWGQPVDDVIAKQMPEPVPDEHMEPES